MEAVELTGTQQIVDTRSEVTPQMTVGAWILTFVILMIPLVNVIMVFIWAFDSASQRRNFARAYLIIAVILIVIWIVIVIAAIALGAFSGIFDFLS